MAESEVECFSPVKQLKIAKRKVELTEKKNIKNLKLREKDVPWTIFPREKQEECTVKQLQRWFLCRRAKTTGKKTQLVQRQVSADRDLPEVICAQKKKKKKNSNLHVPS